MIKKAYKIDGEGFYTEDFIYEEGQKLEENIITTEYTGGLYKPQWNGEKWIEGATQEYIDSINYVPPIEPTIEKRLSSAEEILTMLMGV